MTSAGDVATTAALWVGCDALEDASPSLGAVTPGAHAAEASATITAVATMAQVRDGTRCCLWTRIMHTVWQATPVPGC